MRNIVLIVFCCLSFGHARSQTLTLTNVSQDVFCSSGKDTMKFSVTYSGVPANSNIVFYQSTNAAFDPYAGQGDSIGFIPITGSSSSGTPITSACPKIIGIFIDACNDLGRLEQDNEYIVITSGNAGLLASDLKVDLPNNIGTGNADINTGPAPCTFGTPSGALMTSLMQGSCNATNLFAATQSTFIPANAIVIIFTGNGTNYPYNFSSFCGLGQPIYILQNSCTRSTAAFVNNSGTPCTNSQFRNTNITVNSCFDELTYDRCGLPVYDPGNPNEGDGNYVIQLDNTDTSSVANGGVLNNAADKCNGVALDSASVTQIIKFPIPNDGTSNPVTNYCNTGYHYIKAITNPDGAQPISNTIQFKLICLNLSVFVPNNPICTGDNAVINNNSNDPNATFSWTVSPGANISGASAGSGAQVNQVLTNSGSTRDSVSYQITAVDNSCNIIQIVKIYVDPTPPPFSLGPDTSVCGAFSKKLSTGDPLTIWSTGATAASITVTTPGTYWAKKPASCGDVSDTINILIGGLTSPINLGADTSVCGPFSKTLSTGDATTVWSTGVTASSITVSTSGTYWAKITNGCGTVSDTVVINQSPGLNISITGSTSICTGGSTTLGISGGPFDSVRWSTNATSATISVSSPGQYIVTAYKSGCSGKDTVQVTVGNLTVNITGSLVICSGQSTTLDAGPGYTSYSWSSGAGSQTITTSTPGQYIVNVTQGSCNASDTVVVTSGVSPVVSITGNTEICFGASTILDAGAGFTSYIWNTGASSQTISVNQGGQYIVTVSNGTCTAKDTADVTQLPQITFVLDIDSVTCLSAGKITVTNVLNGTAPFTYQLNNDPAQATDSFPGLSAGGYTVKVTDSKTCSATATATLSAPTPIALQLGNDASIALGTTYNIPGTITGAQSPVAFNWSPTDSLSCTNCVNPVAGPDSSTKYFLQVTDNRGCTSADSITIIVFELIDIYLPNAFTPNGDNSNDVLYVLGNPAKATVEKFMIFNRWGEKVFEADNFPPNDPQFGWDGIYKDQFALIDSYVFYIAAITKSGDRKEYKGTITLLR